ncbi:MAG: hypothetical protein Q9169_000534 [Polycauliona sp. 2 TL-2023]
MHFALFSLLPLLAAAGPVEKRVELSSGFCGAVFNTGACHNSGWSKVWDTLKSHGVDSAVAFTLQPISERESYNTIDPPGACPAPDGFESARLPLVMDPTDTDKAVELLQAKPPPPFLGLFNEPDLSAGGYTPMTSPKDSVKHLSRIIDARTSGTKLLSPVPAYPVSPEHQWLNEFDGNCTGCMDKIDIISAHIYHVKPEDAINQIKDIHDRWQKPIWVTEISPTTRTDNCKFDGDEMIQYMTTVVSGIKDLGYVEKIFWNTGAYGVLAKGYDNICNPSLTNKDGSPTALLDTYKGLCG